jgi:hypothetical protein
MPANPDPVRTITYGADAGPPQRAGRPHRPP